MKGDEGLEQVKVLRLQRLGVLRSQESHRNEVMDQGAGRWSESTESARNVHLRVLRKLKKVNLPG